MCPKGLVKKYLPIAWTRKQPYSRKMTFCPLDWDIFKNIKLSFSYYPSLQALEVHKYEYIEQAEAEVVPSSSSVKFKFLKVS